jgi:predicted Zn-dependent protease
VSYALQAAQTLQTLSYSRNAEDEADEEGYHLLQQAKINPEGMLTFFAKLGKEHPGDTVFRYLSTHPATQDRLAHLRELQPSDSTIYETSPFQSEWAEVKTLCKAHP